MSQRGCLSCADCDMMFRSREEQDKHYSRSGHWYECDQCTREFPNKEKCWTHMDRMDHFMWECQYCDHVFPNEAKLAAHERSHRTHLCKLCDRAFSTDDNLYEHCRIKHHVCPNCHLALRKQAELDQHLMDRHFYCKDCNRTFPSAASLEAHKPIHWKLPCNLCGDSVAAAEMHQHKKSKHQVCTICRCVYLNQAELDQHHINQHFFCKDCDRYFDSRNNIKQVFSHPPPTQTSTLLTC
jgi:transcription elongation factor Elf1